RRSTAPASTADGRFPGLAALLDPGPAAASFTTLAKARAATTSPNEPRTARFLPPDLRSVTQIRRSYVAAPSASRRPHHPAGARYHGCPPGLRPGEKQGQALRRELRPGHDRDAHRPRAAGLRGRAGGTLGGCPGGLL